MSGRRAATLVEILVVVAVLAVLLALILPALQRVREAAARVQGMNQMRQLAVALHGAAAADGGRLPANDRRLYWSLMPHIDGGPEWIDGYLASLPNPPPFKPFLSLADPTLDMPQNNHPDRCSYAFNGSAYARDRRPQLHAAIVDGTSSTIAFAEHYSHCYKPDLLPPPHPMLFVGTFFGFEAEDIGANGRRASFADGARLALGYNTSPTATRSDVLPVTAGTPPVTRASVPGKTFQVRPPLDACDPTVPQTPYPGGMLIALFDGSVRTVRQGVAETVFWSAVTPAGGEVAPLD